LEPNAWQAWNNLGANYLEVKKPNEATEALRKSARLNPRAVSALFNLATALSQLEKHSEAFQAIDHAQRAAGDD
jgi:tetratricopeptide (TPR) repeat protein